MQKAPAMSVVWGLFKAFNCIFVALIRKLYCLIIALLVVFLLPRNIHRHITQPYQLILMLWETPQKLG